MTTTDEQVQKVAATVAANLRALKGHRNVTD